jgi:hypothetical protein
MKRIPIRGKKWRIRIGRLPINKSDAVCLYDERTILISPSTKDKYAALIHEILHASLPDIEEEVIEEIELAILDGVAVLDDCEIS